MRRNVRRGLSYEAVAIIAIVVVVIVTYLSFTKRNPFAGRYTIDAVVPSAMSIKPGAQVRIAGVNVGKVLEVKGVEPGKGQDRGAARIKMEIAEKARPIHKDATLKIRPRIIFEGNFFVDLHPGTPSAPELADGEPIPINQTATPVQFDQVLSALQSDTRTDLRKVLHELNTAFSEDGADAINRTMKYWEPAYKNSAIVNDATLGIREHDLTGYLRGAGRVAEGLDRNSEQLKDLITDLHTTGRAIAAEDVELQRALTELPRTLRAAQPALQALNTALPPLRRLAADLRPGVRSSVRAIDAQIPFVRQLRALVGPNELRGLVADLRPTVPALARLNKATIPLLQQVRAASSCQNEQILPWTKDKIEDPDFPAIGPVYEEQVKPLVGLASESRSHDANGQYFRVSVNAGQFASNLGGGRFQLTNKPLVGANPPKPPSGKRPPLRADVPCETQEAPDLRTEQAAPPPSFRVRNAPPDIEKKAREAASTWLQNELIKTGRIDDVTVSEKPILPSELPRLGKEGGR